MVERDLSGKKLLLIGGTNNTADTVELAHRNGIHLGVADYNKGTYLKKRADSSYDMDALDVEAIANLCRQEGYDGVIQPHSDLLSPYVEKVARKCGFFYPYSEELLRLSQDKKYFKRKCMENGVRVPREYTEDDEDIVYPVIVKPVDGCAARGISVCYDALQLSKAIEIAKQCSRIKGVIIEQFIEGDEINITYIAINGNIHLAAIHDRYFSDKVNSSVKMPDLYIYPSKYTELYEKTMDLNIKSLLHSLGIKNGSLFLQACVRDGKIYIYESGMRLNACKTYQCLETEIDFNSYEHLMQFALTGDMGDECGFTPHFDNYYATVNVLCKTGKRIDKIVGIDELKSYHWIVGINHLYFEGDIVPNNAFGTLGQRLAVIHLFAKNPISLSKRMNRVEQLYNAFDEKGQSVVLGYHQHDDIEYANLKTKSVE